MRALATILVLATCPPAVAQSLEQAVNSTCLTNPGVATATFRVAQSEEGIIEARSALFPRLDSTTQIGLADDGDEVDELRGGLGPLTNARQVSSRLSLSQPLYLGGRARAGIAQAKASRDVELYRRQAELIDLQLDTIEAYVDLARARAQDDVQRSNVRALKEQLGNAERRFELGAGTRSDIVQARSRIGQGEAGVTDAQNAIRQAFVRLRNITGLTTVDDIELPTEPSVPLSIGAALSEAARNNPNARIALAQIEQAEQSIRVAQGERSPNIRLLGNLNIQRDTAFNGFERDEGSLSVEMNIPIFAGGGLASRERSAKLGAALQRSERDRILQRLAETVEREWYNLLASKDLIEVNNGLLKAATQALEAVSREVEAGFRPNVDLLNAQQELLAAEIGLTNARFDTVLSAYRYLGVIGTIGEGRFLKCRDVIGDLPHTTPDLSDQKELSRRWVPWLPVGPDTNRSDRRGPRARR
ncbi:TolC family outer membrane protein [uncultured Algimonas sp.]|uniref:TolC family outer membrane protein n=1 Tax=uncultured Algimonas sp. TaxID=1547920 RepID=UPI00260DD784|nr:TolC family outer membrane protein [uncultured Algimonas sp.]